MSKTANHFSNCKPLTAGELSDLLDIRSNGVKARMTEAQLKKENAALKKEVKELRALVKEADSIIGNVKRLFDFVRYDSVTVVLKPIPLTSAKKKKTAKKK